MPPATTNSPKAAEYSAVWHASVFAPHLSSSTSPCDAAVIGGGIVGLATAMALLRQRPGLRVVVLEAENRLAAHQTGNNSGVIHSGLYYKPSSLKARLCTEGREHLYRFCEEHGIPHDRCGKLVVATSPAELPLLEELRRRGTANGLRNLRILDGAELRTYEPHVHGIAGIFVGETGIVDYSRVAQQYARVIGRLGGEVRTGCRVVSVAAGGGDLLLRTTGGDVRCAVLVNCAGLHSDRVARMCGVEPLVRIVPFRGEYYRLVPPASALVRNLIYPVPDPAFPFLGVHFTRMIGGGVEAGPNAVLAFARHGYSWRCFNSADLADMLGFRGFWKMARRYWRQGLVEMRRSLSRRLFLRALQRLVPAVEDVHLAPGGAGVRAQAIDIHGNLVDDFRIQAVGRMVHVLNAPSPAATASIAIGRYIAQRVLSLI